MIEFRGQGILLDIEGTTSSIQFVYDVMFPFVRRELGDYLRAHWGHDELIETLGQIASEVGHGSFDEWCGAAGNMPAMCADIERLMDADSKTTGLKDLQGKIWESGFQSGQLKAHVFPDVPPAIAAWKLVGLDVRIYSSGSVYAQQLFFRHSVAGDLLPYFRGHYDTTTGPKKEAASYTKIAAEFGLAPAQILFLSDVAAELDAARAAGMQTGLAVRPGNAPAPASHGHGELKSFDELRWQR